MTTIKIHRGDNTDAFNGGFMTITKNDDAYTISKLEVSFAKITKIFENPQFPLAFNLVSSDTLSIPSLGYPLELVVYDNENRKLLIKTDFIVEVVKNTVEVENLPYASPVLNISDYFPTTTPHPQPQPGHEKKGDTYYDIENEKLFVWNGSTWIEIAYEGTCNASYATNAGHATTADSATTASSATTATTATTADTAVNANHALTADLASSASSVEWSNVANKPSTYAPSAHTHGNSDITGIDASKINSGVIDLDRLPQGALDRLIEVDDQTERFALTTSDVQNGDTVQQLDTGIMYRVVDDTKLNSEDGYKQYTAGRASAVPWSGVTDKPSTFTPSSHTHTGSEITSKVSSAETADYLGSTTIGSANQPIYLNNGVPTACKKLEPPPVQSTRNYYYHAIHNRVNTCKNLLAYYTLDELSAMINAGTYDDIYVGDHIDMEMTTNLGTEEEPNNVTETVRWIVAHIDYFHNKTNNYHPQKHIVLVTENCFTTRHRMNPTESTVGGFANSEMYTVTLPKYDDAITEAFGSSHVLPYVQLLTTEINANYASMAGNGFNGASSKHAFATGGEGKPHLTKLMLMSEPQLYGCHPCSSSMHDICMNDTQFALFKEIPNLIHTGRGYNHLQSSGPTYNWLSAVASSKYFAAADNSGSAWTGSANALSVVYIRPYFLFK